MSWKGWLLYLCHIETLFIIGTVTFIIYIRFFGKSTNTFLHLEEIAEKIVSGVSSTEIEIDPSLIKKKPERRVHKHEERCREIFEKIFNAKFESIRPKWLENPATGKALELDGFNPTIITPFGRGLAFEYDGAQHARYTPAFQSSELEFVYQTKKDSWKDKVCKQRRVKLIRIPDYVHYNDLERYIKQALRREGLGYYVRE